MAADRQRALVLGASGQVGRALPGALAALAEVTALGRQDADLASPDSLRDVVRRYRPDVIVNAAAYTAVDRAEVEPALAHAVNAAAPGVLAEAAQAAGAILVHYSTDYVFDGTKTAPYVETDPPAPLSVYGASKLAGERAVAAACARHLIFRTSWVVSAEGTNFVRTMLRLGATRDRLQVVADQRGAPTSARLVAMVTARALAVVREAGDAWGLYHLTAGGSTTWHALARHVLARAHERGVPLRATAAGVEPITTAAFGAAARRPANSVLDTGRLRRTFAVALPDWETEVNDVVDALAMEAAR